MGLVKAVFLRFLLGQDTNMKGVMTMAKSKGGGSKVPGGAAPGGAGGGHNTPIVRKGDK